MISPDSLLQAPMTHCAVYSDKQSNSSTEKIAVSFHEVSITCSRAPSSANVASIQNGRIFGMD